MKTNPTIYKLIHLEGDLIKGSFHTKLQKVKYFDVFLVEKILRKKKKSKMRRYQQ